MRKIKVVDKKRRNKIVGNSKGIAALLLSLLAFRFGGLYQGKSKKVVVKEVQKGAVWS